MENEQLYTIKAVAHKTGLSAHVIRAWEKRYRAIEPVRTSSNRRMYTELEVHRLALLRTAISAGHSIGRIARLPEDALRTLVESAEPAVLQDGGVKSEEQRDVSVKGRLDACINAITRLDGHELELILMRSSIALSQPVLIDELIVPLIQKIGDHWRNGTLRIVHEHLASNVLRTFLANMRSAFEIPETAARMIVTTPSGQLHELGALIASVVAVSEGWHVTYLGPNLPAEEIGTAVNKNHARVLALSLVYPTEDPRLVQELSKLRRIIPGETSIMVGGRATSSYASTLQKMGAQVITDFANLRNILETI